MVIRIDVFAGRRTELLEKLGIRDRTLILFASDNGYSICGYFARGNQEAGWPDDPFFEHKGPFRGGKYSLMEGGVRIPFFVNWPGTIHAGVSSTPVWLVDVLPTFAELADPSSAPESDGSSMVPLLEGKEGGLPPDRSP